MNIDTFWEIIEKAQHGCNYNENPEEMVDTLTQQLLKLDPTDIVKFDICFEIYHTHSLKKRLWAAAFVIDGGESDDGFDYFRAGLIMQGKDVYLNALKEPDSLVDTAADDCNWGVEDFLYLAKEAYFEKIEMDNEQGDDRYMQECEKLEDFCIKQESDALKEIVYHNEIDVEWNEEDLAKIVPKLCIKFDK